MTNTSCQNSFIAEGTCLALFTPVDADYITAVSSPDMFTIDPGLPAPQHTEVVRLLGRFSDIFDKMHPSSGITTDVVHRIDTGEAELVKLRLYHISSLERSTI